MSFKTYSERNKARNSLIKVYGIAADQVDAYLAKDAETGKWGFGYVENSEGAITPVKTDVAELEAGISEELALSENEPQDLVLSALKDAIVASPMPEVYVQAHECTAWPFPSQTTVVEAPPESVLETLVETAPAAPAQDAFSSFAFAQLTANHNLPVAPSEQKKKKVVTEEPATGKIEKDRPEQNGIKRPSAGGKCREVWDNLDNMREALKRTPTSKEIKEVASAKGWENVTTCIQYYQWRKFNGIKGRI